LTQNQKRVIKEKMTRAEQIEIENKQINKLYERCYLKNIVSFDALPEQVKTKILNKEKTNDK
jgi:ribosomal protein S17